MDLAPKPVIICEMWTWGFHAPGPHGCTWFYIDPSRGSQILSEFLGATFAGVVGCDYYFTFLETADVEPTNNAMERGFRHLVIDRKVTQGARGENGRRWCERIWTVMETCVQQGRSAFSFIHDTVVAHFSRSTAPSMLADHA